MVRFSHAFVWARSGLLGHTHSNSRRRLIVSCLGGPFAKDLKSEVVLAAIPTSSFRIGGLSGGVPLVKGLNE